MHEAHRHGIFGSAKTSDVRGLKITRKEFLLKCFDGDGLGYSFQDDLERALSREAEVVKIGFSVS